MYDNPNIIILPNIFDIDISFSDDDISDISDDDIIKSSNTNVIEIIDDTNKNSIF